MSTLLIDEVRKLAVEYPHLKDEMFAIYDRAAAEAETNTKLIPRQIIFDRHRREIMKLIREKGENSCKIKIHDKVDGYYPISICFGHQEVFLDYKDETREAAEWFANQTLKLLTKAGGRFTLDK